MNDDIRENQPALNTMREAQQFKKLLTNIALVGIFGGFVLGAGIAVSTGSTMNVGLGMLVGCLVALAVMLILSIRRSVVLRNRKG